MIVQRFRGLCQGGKGGGSDTYVQRRVFGHTRFSTICQAQMPCQKDATKETNIKYLLFRDRHITAYMLWTIMHLLGFYIRLPQHRARI